METEKTMKKYLTLILSILIMCLTFLNYWFSAELIDSFFLLSLVPILLLFVGWIICFFVSVKNIISKNYLDIISIIILFITILLVIFFPFFKMKVKFELELYKNERLQVIDMVKDGQFKPDDSGNVVLPNQYKKISVSGEIHVYQNDTNHQMIGFWVFRGMLSGSEELIYSTGNEEFIQQHETGHPIISIEKLQDNWYYVITDY